MLTPSRSILEKLYNRLSNEADSNIGFAKRGMSVLLRARNTCIQINGGMTSFARSAAARSRSEETTPKRPKSQRYIFPLTAYQYWDETQR